jgi:quinol-cytochrome oxidoreductase complex cytochrome b subunit
MPANITRLMFVHRASKPKRPAWLIGLLIAIVLMAAALLLANLLGYGDDPAIGAAAAFGG